MGIYCFLFYQICTESMEALNVSYKKISPFYVPYVSTNIGSAVLAGDLVSYNKVVYLEIQDGKI